jgi:DNA-binding response OmpR family regulator
LHKNARMSYPGGLRTSRARTDNQEGLPGQLSRNAPPMQRKPSQILVADDDVSALLDTVKLLKQRDYVVSSVSTLEDAYARLTEQPPDLVIAGSRFGSMNGLQFIVSCRTRRPDVAGLIIAAQPEHVSEMDAWRHGIAAVFRPLDTEHFLMTVAEKLATIRQRQRWPRKRVTSYVPLQIGRVPARLLDVSYGGLRFQLDGESYQLKSPIRIDIPASRLQVDAALVWSARATDGATCLCGVELLGERNRAHAWRAFVDRVS